MAIRVNITLCEQSLRAIADMMRHNENLCAFAGKAGVMAKTFEVKYSFKCPGSGCLKQTMNTMTIAAPDSADASELAIAGLACEYCHKKLPRGYFVHTSVKEIK